MRSLKAILICNKCNFTLITEINDEIKFARNLIDNSDRLLAHHENCEKRNTSLKGGATVKKLTFIPLLLLINFILAQPAFAQVATTTSGSVTQIVTFIQSIVQVLITLAGTVAVGFFVWGGFGYITSTGHPEALDRAKKTIIYSGIGLAIVLGAFVLSGIVSQLANTAFGATH